MKDEEQPTASAQSTDTNTTAQAGGEEQRQTSHDVEEFREAVTAVEEPPSYQVIKESEDVEAPFTETETRTLASLTEEQRQASPGFVRCLELYGTYYGGKRLVMIDGRESLFMRFEHAYVIVFGAPKRGGEEGETFSSQLVLSREGMHGLYMLYYVTSIADGVFEADLDRFDANLAPEYAEKLKAIFEPLREKLVPTIEGVEIVVVDNETLRIQWQQPADDLASRVAYYKVEFDGGAISYQVGRGSTSFEYAVPAGMSRTTLVVRAFDDDDNLLAISPTAALSFRLARGERVRLIDDNPTPVAVTLDRVIRPDAESQPTAPVGLQSEVEGEQVKHSWQPVAETKTVDSPGEITDSRGVTYDNTSGFSKDDVGQ